MVFRMLEEKVRERALELAESIKELEEYKEFVNMERNLKEDEIAQELLVEFQQKQQDFVTKQLSGEFDQELLGELTELQSKLNARESVVRFIESYNRLLSVLGEIVDLISEKIEVDLGEVYRR
jgi:cell fate (sporulation/competence/biofilm development) regulator YlbF (YheA/YmcA/DUF963 family)